MKGRQHLSAYYLLLPHYSGVAANVILHTCVFVCACAHITVKLYTHSQIGFVNYTKQLFLNGYTSTCLVENCYVCRCVETRCRI